MHEFLQADRKLKITKAENTLDKIGQNDCWKKKKDHSFLQLSKQEVVSIELCIKPKKVQHNWDADQDVSSFIHLDMTSPASKAVYILSHIKEVKSQPVILS